jgi:hypothetical protein
VRLERRTKRSSRRDTFAHALTHTRTHAHSRSSGGGSYDRFRFASGRRSSWAAIGGVFDCVCSAALPATPTQATSWTSRTRRLRRCRPTSKTATSSLPGSSAERCAGVEARQPVSSTHCVECRRRACVIVVLLLLLLRHRRSCVGEDDDHSSGRGDDHGDAMVDGDGHHRCGRQVERQYEQFGHQKNPFDLSPVEGSEPVKYDARKVRKDSFVDRTASLLHQVRV